MMVEAIKTGSQVEVDMRKNKTQSTNNSELQRKIQFNRKLQTYFLYFRNDRMQPYKKK